MARVLLLLSAAFIVACAAKDEAATTAVASADSTPWRQPGDVIDSIFPMEEQMRRFREGLPQVTALAGGATSREALVRGFMTAVEQRDTAFFHDALLNRQEFAWLYFEHHQFAKPPYEMPPGLFWFQNQQRSEKGIGRLLERFGGRPLHYQTHRCPDEGTKAFGNGRVYGACKVIYDRPGVGRDTLALFSGIFELSGRFKFVSYSNDF